MLTETLWGRQATYYQASPQRYDRQSHQKWSIAKLLIIKSMWEEGEMGFQKSCLFQPWAVHNLFPQQRDCFLFNKALTHSEECIPLQVCWLQALCRTRWLPWRPVLTKYKPWTFSILVTNSLLTVHLRTVEADGASEGVYIHISIHSRGFLFHIWTESRDICFGFKDNLDIRVFFFFVSVVKECLESSVFSHDILFFKNLHFSYQILIHWRLVMAWYSKTPIAFIT